MHPAISIAPSPRRLAPIHYFSPASDPPSRSQGVPHYPSPRGVATINNELAARHEGARITEQEQRRALELLRRAQPPHHVLARPQRLEVRLVIEVLLHHRRHNVPGRQAVDADPVRRPLHRQVLAELDHSRLAGVVDGRNQPLVGDLARHAGNQHDVPGRAAGNHLPSCGGGREHHAAEVDVHHLAHVCLRVVDRRLHALDARGGDEAVEARFLGRDGGKGRLHLGDVAHVDLCVVQRADGLGVGGRARLRCEEVGAGFRAAIEAVDCDLAALVLVFGNCGAVWWRGWGGFGRTYRFRRLRRGPRPWLIRGRGRLR